MKIKKLETFTKPYVSFVKTTLEDGSQGFGQMSTYHADITSADISQTSRTVGFR